MIVLSLFVGLVWGWGLYQAIMNKDKVWTILLSIYFAGIVADRAYNNTVMNGFIEGLGL